MKAMATKTSQKKPAPPTPTSSTNAIITTPTTQLPRFQWGAKRRMAYERAISAAAAAAEARATPPPKAGTSKPKPKKLQTPPVVPPENNRQKRNEKPPAEFRLTLTKEEIEADFIKMTGYKPPRKPNRRTKNIQTKIDVGFPGLLVPKSIAPDRYGNN